MNPIYLDIHIHTSDNPDSLNLNYDVTALKKGIEAISGGNNYLVSLTDHNVINEKAYMKAANELANVILGENYIFEIIKMRLPIIAIYFSTWKR